MAQGKFSRVVNRKGIMALSFGAMIGWGWVAPGAGLLWWRQGGGNQSPPVLSE